MIVKNGQDKIEGDAAKFRRRRRRLFSRPAHPEKDVGFLQPNLRFLPLRATKKIGAPLRRFICTVLPYLPAEPGKTGTAGVFSDGNKEKSMANPCAGEPMRVQ